jgi:hypothetical protein
MYQARAQILLFSPRRISASCLASHVNGLSVVAEEFVAMFGLFFSPLVGARKITIC